MGQVENVFEERLLSCSPPLVLAEAPFDLLEVYSGCAQLSDSWRAKGLKVLPPLDIKNGWDLLDPALFVGLMSFVRARKVLFLWWAPPCTTFSLARCPKVRSLDAPWGFDLLADCVVEGNLHACQSILLAALQLMVGLFMAL